MLPQSDYDDPPRAKIPGQHRKYPQELGRTLSISTTIAHWYSALQPASWWVCFMLVVSFSGKLFSPLTRFS